MKPSNNKTVKAWITMYSPQKFYGFCEAVHEKIFFHLETFTPGQIPLDESPIPPIVGEPVEVSFTTEIKPGAQAPRASKVTRLEDPVQMKGIVESFDTKKGWGFCRGDNGVSYYLHSSEIKGNSVPFKGRRVVFYCGFRNNRPRACYVQVVL